MAQRKLLITLMFFAVAVTGCEDEPKPDWKEGYIRVHVASGYKGFVASEKLNWPLSVSYEGPNGSSYVSGHMAWGTEDIPLVARGKKSVWNLSGFNLSELGGMIRKPELSNRLLDRIMRAARRKRVDVVVIENRRKWSYDEPDSDREYSYVPPKDSPYLQPVRALEELKPLYEEALSRAASVDYAGAIALLDSLPYPREGYLEIKRIQDYHQRQAEIARRKREREERESGHSSYSYSQLSYPSSSYPLPRDRDPSWIAFDHARRAEELADLNNQVVLEALRHVEGLTPARSLNLLRRLYPDADRFKPVQGVEESFAIVIDRVKFDILTTRVRLVEQVVDKGAYDAYLRLMTHWLGAREPAVVFFPGVFWRK